ncbi:hypothetical protein IMZ11_26825 [Microtetraspora sp. AC03309]|uniref:hypothetical protein n=1 Tax=Microtetraspora sp. AC03309 TaxID=2779376 RepID=UPI001E503491|nr:hypothetical protein [Microtetraspora sp. AC03309]MCC5579247.1 hypothetical protein [Microtetraspora sp. AC03309]
MTAVKERQELMRLFIRESAADRACRAALRSMASYTIWEDPIPLRPLLTTFRRRARLLRRLGTPTLDFDETVARLEACGLEVVCLGLVQAADPPYHFQLFLTPGLDQLIACLGVKRPTPS